MFLGTFVGIGAVLATTIAAASRIVDPDGAFGTKVFPVIVIDARTEKQALFQRYAAEAPVEGLIVGSSKSMKLEPSAAMAATGQRFFNFAVESARAEDYLAIYRWVRRQQPKRLRTLLIGVDVEALHDNDIWEGMLQFNRPLSSELEPRSRAVLELKKYRRVFSVTHLRDVTTSVLLREGIGASPRATKFFEADGFSRIPERVSTLAACNAANLPRYASMNRVSPKRLATLKEVISEARADGVTVKVWLTPLKPETVQFMEARTRFKELIDDVRMSLQELRRTPGVETYDFSTVEAFGGDADGWDDCTHLDERNAHAVLDRLLSST